MEELTKTLDELGEETEKVKTTLNNRQRENNGLTDCFRNKLTADVPTDEEVRAYLKGVEKRELRINETHSIAYCLIRLFVQLLIPLLILGAVAWILVQSW